MIKIISLYFTKNIVDILHIIPYNYFAVLSLIKFYYLEQ